MKFSAPPAVQNILDLAQPYSPYLLAVAICAALGLALGVIRINVSTGASEQPERWALPSLTPPQIPNMTADEVTASFWTEQPREAKKTAETEPVKKPEGQWRFIGTIDQGQILVAVIEVDGKKLQRLKSGDFLPDGSSLKEVSESAISIERQGALQSMRLFLEKKVE